MCRRSRPLARGAASAQEAALYRVACFTGLRLGELRALRWMDVDFANATLHVRRNRPTHGTREKAPKGGLVRSLPLWDQAAQALDGLSRRGYVTRPDDPVFVTETGSRLAPTSVTRAFHRALDRAELGHLRERSTPIRFHDLRHSYGTLAINVYNPVDVQSFMGHSDLRTTMRYLHAQPKTDAAAKGSAYIAAQLQPELELLAA